MLNGTVLKGTIQKGEEYMLGPDQNGKFKAMKVYGIHSNKTNTQKAG